MMHAMHAAAADTYRAGVVPGPINQPINHRRERIMQSRGGGTLPGWHAPPHVKRPVLRQHPRFVLPKACLSMPADNVGSQRVGQDSSLLEAPHVQDGCASRLRHRLSVHQLGVRAGLEGLQKGLASRAAHALTDCMVVGASVGLAGREQRASGRRARLKRK